MARLATKTPLAVPTPISHGPARAVVTGPQEGTRTPPEGFDPHPDPHKIAAELEKFEEKKLKSDKLEKEQKGTTMEKNVKVLEDPHQKRQDALVGDPTYSEAKPSELANLMNIVPPPFPKPSQPPSRRQSAQHAIQRQRLKPGMVMVRDTRYLLR